MLHTAPAKQSCRTCAHSRAFIHEYKGVRLAFCEAPAAHIRMPNSSVLVDHNCGALCEWYKAAPLKLQAQNEQKHE